MRRRLVALLVAAALSPAAPHVRAAARADEPAALSGRTAVDACTALTAPATAVGYPGCTTVRAVLNGLAAECRRRGDASESCAVVDGQRLGEAAIRRYERSWVHRALTLQRALDDAAPLVESLLPHTHNSFNSSTYAASVTNQDPNQVVSLRDQLRLDVRALELDLHWFGDRVVLCHGRTVDVAGATAHAGCSVDRPFEDGLREVRSWLDVAGNRGDVVLLYLENQLDGSPQAHEAATRTLVQVLGDRVLRPRARCGALPVDSSRAAVRAAGAQVLVVGRCGPGSWGGWVHEWGPRWDEASSPAGTDYPDARGCGAERRRERYGERLIRRYEDSTWLGAVAASGGSLTTEDTRRMVACGVNLIAFDQLTPDDPRLAALVWSWAPGEPTTAGECARQGADGRLRATPCAAVLPFACATPGGTWRLTRTRGPWLAGAAVCAIEHPGSVFSVPVNGYRNELLRTARPAGTDVWVNSDRQPTGWTPHTSPHDPPAPRRAAPAA